MLPEVVRQACKLCMAVSLMQGQEWELSVAEDSSRESTSTWHLLRLETQVGVDYKDL
jgi:hypothetical protein